MSQPNKLLWSLDSNTRDFREVVESKIEELKSELSDGSLLMSNKIDIEYAHNTGIISGLKFLIEYISGDESYDSSESVFGEDGNRSY